MSKKGGNPHKLVPFKKGNDPRRNLKGAPPKLPQLDILLDKVLGAEKDGMTAAERIIEALQRKANNGDVRAAELLLDRAYGKAKQSIDLSGHTTQTQIILSDKQVKEINKDLEGEV